MMEYKGVNSASYQKFHTKMKITKSSLVQKLVLLVHTWSKELVPLVQGGHLRFEHDRVLLRQAKSAGVGGGVEGGVLLQDFPPDVELPPLVLQLPHVAGQGGADPLVTVLHVGLVAAVPFLPWWLCYKFGKECRWKNIQLTSQMQLFLQGCPQLSMASNASTWLQKFLS